MKQMKQGDMVEVTVVKPVDYIQSHVPGDKVMVPWCLAQRWQRDGYATHRVGQPEIKAPAAAPRPVVQPHE